MGVYEEEQESRGYFNIRFDIDYDYDNIDLEVRGERFETDGEFEARMEDKKKFEEKKKAEAAKKEAAERELYETLKRKFEK